MLARAILILLLRDRPVVSRFRRRRGINLSHGIIIEQDGDESLSQIGLCALHAKHVSIFANIMKQDHQIDLIDRRILAALQRDAAITHAELAEKVGASTASCWRRIKALEAAGILLETVRLVDAESVGRRVNVLCNVRMRSHEPGARAAFEEFARSSPEVMECFSMSGDWDYLLRILVADVADYERFLMRSLLGHASVATASSHFALGLIKHSSAIPV
jgi:Lrp/AsnC family transcriptional regulator